MLAEGQSLSVKLCRLNEKTIRVSSNGVDVPESDEFANRLARQFGVEIPVSIELAEYHGGFDISDNDVVVDWHRLEE